MQRYKRIAIIAKPLSYKNKGLQLLAVIGIAERNNYQCKKLEKVAIIRRIIN